MKPTLPPPTRAPDALPRLEEIPGALPENTRLRRQKGLPTRVSKRAEESEPSAEYVAKLEKLGPREGESFLAFRKRMCVIVGIRSLWVETWRKFGGNRVDVARALGIPANNIAFELRTVGLTVQLLNDALLGKVKL